MRRRHDSMRWRAMRCVRGRNGQRRAESAERAARRDRRDREASETFENTEKSESDKAAPAIPEMEHPRVRDAGRCSLAPGSATAVHAVLSGMTQWRVAEWGGPTSESRTVSHRAGHERGQSSRAQRKGSQASSPLSRATTPLARGRGRRASRHTPGRRRPGDDARRAAHKDPMHNGITARLNTRRAGNRTGQRSGSHIFTGPNARTSGQPAAAQP